MFVCDRLCVCPCYVKLMPVCVFLYLFAYASRCSWYCLFACVRICWILFVIVHVCSSLFAFWSCLFMPFRECSNLFAFASFWPLQFAIVRISLRLLAVVRDCMLLSVFVRFR